MKITFTGPKPGDEWAHHKVRFADDASIVLNAYGGVITVISGGGMQPGKIVEVNGSEVTVDWGYPVADVELHDQLQNMEFEPGVVCKESDWEDLPDGTRLIKHCILTSVSIVPKQGRAGE